MKYYRIVTDRYEGFEVQVKEVTNFLFFTCHSSWRMPVTNTVSSLEKAKELIEVFKERDRGKKLTLKKLAPEVGIVVYSE